MKIAVTGGGGFIGAATVARALELGHEAWRFDRQDGHDVLDDLRGLKGAECVVHLAGMLGTAELFDQAEQAVEANVVGTLRVLQWCRDNDARYVGISMPDSDWANVYQATKLCAMRLATAWHEAYGVPVSHVCAYNAFGPGQKHGPGHPQKIIPAFSTWAWAGKPIQIWGSGMQSVDLVHVDDVARMLVDATGYGDDEVFDAGTGTSTMVRAVAAFVNRVTGQPMTNVEHLPMRKGEEAETEIVARGNGWETLGWQPMLDWEKLQKAVEWYRP